MADELNVSPEWVEAARKEGYSDREIVDYIGKSPALSEWVTSARKEGYSPSEIVDYLAPKPAPKEKPPAEAKKPATIGDDFERGLINAQADSQMLGAAVLGRSAAAIEASKGKADRGEFLSPFEREQARQYDEAKGNTQRQFAEAVGKAIDYRKQADELPISSEYKAFKDAAGKGFGDAIKAFWKAPGEVVTSILAEGAVASAPSLGAAMVGGLGAGATVAAGQAYLQSYAGKVVELLAKKGVDINSKDAVIKALSDPAVADQIRNDAALSAIPQAAAGAGGMLIAGKTLAPSSLAARPVAQQAVNIPAQAGAQGLIAMAGEAGSSAIIGEHLEGGKMAAAFLGGAAQGPLDVAAFAAHRAAGKVRGDWDAVSRPPPPATEETGRKVMDAPNLDDAITLARADIDAAIADHLSLGDEAGRKQADILTIFSRSLGQLGGEIQQDKAGNYFWVNGDEVAALKPWDGSQREDTISPALAQAQADTYGRMGFKVVYIDDANTPFDGATNPAAPDTIFLSTRPDRNAAMIGAHEVGHLLENTTLSDGTNLGTLFLEAIQRGVTEEGIAHARRTFGESEGAPRRERFADGREGDAAFAAAEFRFLIQELAADVHGEAPKFQTFLPRVIDAVLARYGADEAKGVLAKFIAGIRESMQRLHEMFFGGEEAAAYGTRELKSQNWLTNLGEVHDIAARMYAERFGTQAEKENAKLRDMRERQERSVMLERSRAPAGEVPPPTAPEGFTDGQPVAAVEAPAPAGLINAAAEAPPVVEAPTEPQRPSGPAPGPAYAEAARKVVIYRRWLAELDEKRRADAPTSPAAQALQGQIDTILSKVRGNEDRLTNAARDRLEAARTALAEVLDPIGDSPDMARVREAMEAEQAIMADAAAVGTPSPGMQRAAGRNAYGRRAPAPRAGAPVIRGEAVMPTVRPEAPAAATGEAPLGRLEVPVQNAPVEAPAAPTQLQREQDAVRAMQRPQVEEPAAAPEPVPENTATFDAAVQAERDAIWADKGLVGKLQQGLTRNEQWVADLARERLMRRQAQEDLDWFLENGLPADEVERVAKFYRPRDGESPREALDRAVDRWTTMEEAKAHWLYGDEDVATYDWLKAETKVDPLLADAYTILENHYRGRPLEYREENDIIPFPEGPQPTSTAEDRRQEAARGAPQGRGGPEAGAEPRGRGEADRAAPELGDGSQFSPRQDERPLLETREATKEELDARQRQADKQLAEANMRGRKVAGRPQESAEDTPLFGGDRQKSLFSPRVRNEADAAQLTDRAKFLFGTTRNPREAGYILRDGTMLDMSGRHEAVGYEADRNGRYVPKDGEPDYLAGNRHVDHRDVAQQLVEASGSKAMFDFQSRTGALRVDLNAGIVSATVVPTPRQLDAIVRAAREMRVRDVVVEYDSPEGRTISHANVQNITARNLARVFNEPMQGETLFSPRQINLSPEERAHTVIDILAPEFPAQAPRSRSVEAIARSLMTRGSEALRKMGVKSGKITDQMDGRTNVMLAKAIAAEVADALKRGGNHAGDWYTSKVREAMAIAGTIHPEIKSDPHQAFGFKAALAITSQNETVPSNVRLAEQVYAHFKKTGRFPTNVVASKQVAMNGNFKKLNKLLDVLGDKGAREFLTTEFTRRELEDAGWKIGGENMETRVYGSAILGPKIGQGFYQNLNGNYRPVTMDLWFMRAWGRLTGTLSGKTDISKQRTRLEDALRDEKRPVPKSLATLTGIAERIVLQHERDYRKFGAEYKSGKRTKSELVYAAERLLEGLNGINETPTSGSQRDWMRSVVNSARRLLAYNGIRLSNADLQAVWWYPEKDLYAKLGGRDSEAINVSYSEALRDLALKKGVKDADLERAVRALDQRPGSGQRGVDDRRAGRARGAEDRRLDEVQGLAPEEREFTGISTPAEEARRTGRLDLTTDSMFSPRQAKDPQTDTPEFKRFFRQSKAVDGDGEPLRLYHATDAEDFTVFDTMDFGSWFAENPATADIYKHKGNGGTPRVYEVYLRAENPLRIPERFDLSDDQEVREVLAAINKANGTRITPEQIGYDADYVGTAAEFIGLNDKFVAEIKKAGFDSIHGFEQGQSTWAVLDAEQIKSATDNNGAFDPADPDIRMSPRQIDTPEFKQFFGKSKATGDGGKPLRLYHGSLENLTSFDTNRPDRGMYQTWMQNFSRIGSFFSESPTNAESFPFRSRGTDWNEGRTVYPVYLRIENPKAYRAVRDAGRDMERAGGVEAWKRKLQAEGYDGITLSEGPSWNPTKRDLKAKVWVAFEPEQIKSAIGNRGTFDRNDPDISMSPRQREERKPAPVFYSGVERAVQAAKIEKAAPGQWLGTLKNMPGVKPEEVQWLGLEDWLKSQPKSVTKQEVLDYVRANQIKVKEVLKGDGTPQTAAIDEAVTFLVDQKWGPPDLTRQMVEDAMSEARNGDFFALNEVGEMLPVPIDEALRRHLNQEPSGTRHSTFALPGGENYRELLLTLPAQRGDAPEYQVVNQKLISKYGSLADAFEHWTPAEAAEFDRVHGEVGDANPRDLKYGDEGLFRNSHWDEPNVLAHIRFDDRMVGNQKVLHVAEIQSDWHQQGRKRGYQKAKTWPDLEKAGYKIESHEDGSYWVLSNENGDPVSEGKSRDEAISDYLKRDPDRLNGVPDAPFKTTWPELAMKRVIRYAAENGYDRVSWDTGATNADRFDLSKQISKVTLHDASSGGVGKADLSAPFEKGTVRAYDHDGQRVIDRYVDSEEKLAELIGKEAAQKLLAAKPRATDVAGLGMRERSLEGLDLKVGGEGMAAFYDKQLPIIANKLGKKFGAKAERSEMEFGEEGKWIIDAEDVGADPDEKQEVIVRDRITLDGVHEPFDTLRAAEEWLEANEPTGVEVHTMDITDAMRQSVVEEGQSLFSPRARRPVRKPAPVFHSGVERAIESAKIEKATPGQWLGSLKNMPGVKPEEVQYLGLEDWLRQQPKAVTKSEVLDYVRANQIEVNEVLRAGEEDDVMSDRHRAVQEDWIYDQLRKHEFKGAGRKWSVLDPSGDPVFGNMTFVSKEVASAALTRHLDELSSDMPTSYMLDDLGRRREEDIPADAVGGTRHGEWTLPGGKNYRELLLTLPEATQSGATAKKNAFVKKMMEKYGEADGTPVYQRLNADDREQWDALLSKSIEYLKGKPATYRSTHWDEPNVLAHVRFDERTGPKGEKVLHIAEVQSDWHQAGKKEGYRGQVQEKGLPLTRANVEAEVRRHIPGEDLGDLIDAVYDEAQRGPQALSDALLNDLGMDPPDADRLTQTFFPGTGIQTGVPDAPFKTTWPELAMKRMIRYAAENGYDRISWDNAEIVSGRFDKNEQGESIIATRKDDGTFDLDVTVDGRDGPIPWKRGVAAADLKRLNMEKGLAEKMLAQNERTAEYPTEEAYIANPGMTNFYDKKLGQIANKIGKKFGASVETADIAPSSDKLYEAVERSVPDLGKRWFVVDTSNDTRVAGPWSKMTDAQAWIDHNGTFVTKPIKVNSMPITEALRDAVVYEGQSLFSPRQGQRVFRGSMDREERLEGRSFPGVWMTPDQKNASQYGKNVSSYRLPVEGLNLLDVESAEAWRLKEWWMKAEGYGPEDIAEARGGEMLDNDPIPFPDKNWVALLRGHGYDGHREGDNIFVADHALEKISPDTGDEGQFSPRQTDTPELRRWLGNSKVVEEDGTPKVAYHATDVTRAIGKFRTPAYFASTPDFAEAFGKGTVYPVYLKIENPYVIDAAVSGRHFKWDRNDIARMKREGYDGVIVKGDKGDADIYTVFDANQIKSAIGNRGTFDPADPDIRMSPRQLTERQFRSEYFQHVDIKGRRDGTAEQTLAEVMRDGWKPGLGGNALPVTLGERPADVLTQRYMPRAGDVVYLVPRAWQRDTGNGVAIKEGWKPKPWEVIRVEQDNPSMHDEYLKAVEQHQGEGSQFSPRVKGAESYSDDQRRAAERVRGVEGRSLAERIDEVRQDLGKKIVREMFDPYVGVKDRDAAGYLALRNANSVTGAVDMFNTYGPLKFDGSTYGVVEKTGGPNALIRDLGDDAMRFMDWVAANRAERLKGEDRENLYSDEDISTLKTLNQGTLDSDYTLSNGRTTRSREAAYLDALNRLDQINKNARDLAVESGLVKRDVVDALWADPYYVPFYRQADEGNSRQFVGASTSGMTSKTAGKKLKGGTDKLNNDLWANAFGNWAHMIDASLRNKAANQVLMQAETDGIVTRVTAADYENRMSKAEKADAVWTMVDGEKQYWRVDDPFTLKAIAALDYVRSDSPFMGIGRAAKKLLQTGVAASPIFQIRSLIRDTENSIAVSPISLNIFKNLADGAKQQDVSNGLQNVARAVAGKKLEQGDISLETANAIAGGATMRYAAGVDQSFHGSDTYLDSASKIGKFWDYFRRVGQASTEAMAFGENMNRLALYKQLGEQGAPNDLRAFQGRDLSDFTLTGASPIIRHVVEVVPYMNAWMQGLYKVGRTAADADKNVALAVGGRVAVQLTTRLAAVVAGMVAANLALDAIYADDPDYQNRSEYDRNSNFWFKVGGTEFRVPMGFEVAALSRLAAIWTETLYDKNMTLGRAWKNTLQIFGTQMAFNPIPQAVKPLLDVRANETRTGSPIESKSMERLRPEFRANAETTLVSRGISTGLNKAARAIGGQGAQAFSPVELDYLVGAYAGWLGTTALQIADTAVRAMSDEPVKPAKDWVAKATGGMVSNDRTSERASGFYVDLLYKQGAAIQEAYATFQDLSKSGRGAEAKSYLEANRDLIRKYPAYSQAIRAEGEINQQIKLITESSSLTAEQKRVRIMQLNATKTRVAERVFRAMPQ